MLTILGDGQPFLGVNVPHLDCVGCGMSEGRIVEVVVRSVVERIEIPLEVLSLAVVDRKSKGGRVVRRLIDRCGLARLV